MSAQRNIQKTRHISSAPADTTHRKHVHFREIHSADSARRHDCPTNSLQSAIQHGQLALADAADSLLPSNSHTLSQSSASTSSTPKTGSFYRLPDDLLARGDFIAYQGANVTDFFNTTSTTRAKRVSEICLVNDHYILVKIPAAQMEHVATMDTIAEEEGSTSADCAQRKGFLRYFPCPRSRRVLPVTTMSKAKLEETKHAYADKKQSILKCPMAHCWRVNETQPEVFETRTKIFGVFWRNQKAPGKVITIQPSKMDIAEPLDLRNKPARITENGLSTREHENKIDTGAFGSPINSLTKPPLFGGALQTSLHDTVTLEQHAAWINNDELDIKAVLRKDNNKSAVESKTAKSKRRANVFRWFFKRAKAPKPKTKLHAVVYKTYFVRWKKPPDDKCPHCGHSRNDGVSAVATCKWKRCRSATF